LQFKISDLKGERGCDGKRLDVVLRIDRCRLGVELRISEIRGGIRLVATSGNNIRAYLDPGGHAGKNLGGNQRERL